MESLKMRIKPTDALYTESADSPIYQRADAFLIGMGEGKDSTLYKKIMHPGVNPAEATGSSPLLNMAIQQILPNGQRVASLDDIVRRIIEAEKNGLENPFNRIYSDTTEIILYSPIPSTPENTQIIRSLIGIADSKEYTAESPLRFTNLAITRDNNSQNPYGVAFKTTTETKVENDPRFAYSNSGKKVTFNGKDITVLTKENGLSRLCAYGGDLDAWDGFLADSGGDGRVIISSEGASS